MIRLTLICISAVLLAACGESDQTQSANRHLPDVAPYQGAKNVHVVKGWAPGDKKAWETQLRNRAQTQNEYVKVN
ncbi:MAG: hypothetical protein JWM42_2866 [Burkholderia sp.]|nr:hypothetical protein [Burkholderia sp.]